MKKTIAILLVVVMALSLAACSKSKDAKKDEKKNVNPIVGTWELDVSSMLSEKDLSMMAELGMTMSMTFVFNEDGTGSVSGNMMNDTMDKTFKYTIENNQIVIDGEGADYTIDGDKLTIDMDGQMMTFNRK